MLPKCSSRCRCTTQTNSARNNGKYRPLLPPSTCVRTKRSAMVTEPMKAHMINMYWISAAIEYGSSACGAYSSAMAGAYLK